MIIFLINLINFLSQALILVVIVSIILSYFMQPYHPVRRALDTIVEPLLAPIRRIVPLVGMIDFSPLILIILIEIVSYGLKNLLYVLR
jgi:YggT family protein